MMKGYLEHTKNIYFDIVTIKYNHSMPLNVSYQKYVSILVQLS